MTEQSTLSVAMPPITADRRRPERREVRASLLPLLREQELDLIPGSAESVLFGHDQTAPARGIAVAVLLSIPLWAMVIGLVRWMS